jgi:diacylglycerol kinase (ATP)
VFVSLEDKRQSAKASAIDLDLKIDSKETFLRMRLLRRGAILAIIGHLEWVMPRGSIIYNPAAGRFPAGPFIESAMKVLSTGGWDIKAVRTSSPESLSKEAHQAVERQEDVVFVAGGDGSVGAVASILANSSTALAVLPAGTANVWAKALGLQHLDWFHWFALEDAASRLSRGTYHWADLGECNGQDFMLWAGIGLDAEIVQNVEPRGRWEKSLGTAQYASKAMWQTLGWEGIHLNVNSPELDLEGKFLVAIASNIRAYAGGYVELALNAKIDDGKLDFWLFEGSSFKDVFVHVLQVLRGKHVDAPGVIHFQASESSFSTEEKLPFQMDGEVRRITSPAHFRIREKVLRVLVPFGGDLSMFSDSEPSLKSD